MADSYTTTASLDFDQTMWDLALYYGLRPQLYFDQFADVKSTDSAPNRGTAVTFTLFTDMAAATTALNESVDVNAVALADTQVTVTLAEYGNATLPTWRVRATSFIDLDRGIANLIGYNAGLSMDSIALNTFQAGTNVRYATGSGAAPISRATVVPANTIRATDVRRAYADLYGANVAMFGNMYAAIIHPDVSFDLRSETGAAAWRDPHTYSQPQEIWTGELGEFEGFRFVVSPRAPLFADAGSATTLTDVYRTLFFGRQSMAKAYSTFEGHGEQPVVVVGPVVDHLRRFRSIGWHHYAGYGIFRQAALRAVESASSIGTNA